MQIDIKSNPELIQNVKVLLDGRNVSNECFAADDNEGWVELYLLNDTGCKYLGAGGKAAWGRFFGKVEIVKK